MKFNWGHGILIFMIVFVSLATIFIIYSLNQSQDLVSNDYYDQGAEYSKQIEINKRSSLYKDSITFTQLDSEIEVKLCYSLMSTKDTMLVYFYRPSDKSADLKLKFPMAELIRISETKFKQGRYIVKMSWNQHGEVYNTEKELFIK